MSHQIITSTRIENNTYLRREGDVLVVATLNDGSETVLAGVYSDEGTYWSLTGINFVGASLEWAKEEVRGVFQREWGLYFQNPHPRTPKTEAVEVTPVVEPNYPPVEFFETDLEELDF